MHRYSLSLLAGLGSFALLAPCAVAQQLIGRAVLPARTFAPGPTSGQFITTANGEPATPYINLQPVQGFSAVLDNHDGSFLVMPDNGYGSAANSADFVLRYYNVTPDFKTASGGSGNIAVNSWVTLSDPNRQIPWQIVADQTNYPNGGNNIPVDATIKNQRLLTGSDFDIESFRRTRDGSVWFGEEFGPYLVKTNAAGQVVRAPIALPGVASPDDKLGRPANLPRSKGFEGMALSANGNKLYTLLEGPLNTDTNRRRLEIDEFSLASESFTGRKLYYRMENPYNIGSATDGQAIGDMTAINDHQYLVIERDNFQGSAARFKKVYLVDFNEIDADGFVKKTELVDLMNIADPNNIGGLGSTFTFPFVTIEDIVVLDPWTLGILNDNNYPFSSGRTPGVVDNNEFIKIRLNSPLYVTSLEVVPEPGTVALLAAGLYCAMAFARRRRSRR